MENEKNDEVTDLAGQAETKTDELKDIENQLLEDDVKIKAQAVELEKRQERLKKGTEIAMQASELAERQAGLAKRREEIEVQEKELADKERLAAVKAKQLEVDEREDGMQETDKMIANYESGSKVKAGQPFIDSQGNQHAGNCNSHPSKQSRYPCDCGRNGTPRYKKQN